MRIIIVFIVLSLSSCATLDFKHFLNDFEILAQTKNESPTLSVRVLKVRELGECNQNSCPKERLYIAVSEFGEDPKQNVFITETADRWEFIKWSQLPELGRYPYKVVFNVGLEDQGFKYSQQITVDTGSIYYSQKKNR